MAEFKAGIISCYEDLQDIAIISDLKTFNFIDD